MVQTGQVDITAGVYRVVKARKVGPFIKFNMVENLSIPCESTLEQWEVTSVSQV
jgi:hypothetical protein